MKPKLKMTIEIDNLTEPQKMAIEDLLATWVQLGNLGGSRWTAFYSDGDGDFRPKITVDGNKPKFVDLPGFDRKEEFWIHPDELITTEMYAVDFDSIAWNIPDDK